MEHCHGAVQSKRDNEAHAGARASGADLRALTEAAAWAAGDDETVPRRHLPPHGKAAQVLEILQAGGTPDGDDTSNLVG